MRWNLACRTSLYRPGRRRRLPGTGTGTGTGSGDSGTGTSNNALNTLLSQSWGASAVNEAEALGVNPSALAATCVVESGCQNVGSSSGSSATGAFQMQSAAFQDGLNTALAANPELASEVVQGSAGMNDPTTEAIAASGYLMQAASTLQSAGISNPTVLDARSYYEFGPNYGTQVAQAQGSALMSSILPSSFLAQNGISQTETVAEWQAGVAAKVGNAATQPGTVIARGRGESDNDESSAQHMRLSCPFVSVSHTHRGFRQCVRCLVMSAWRSTFHSSR